jgi:hypothetical protein
MYNDKSSKKNMEGIYNMEKYDFGLIISKLEKLEDFFPCFKTMIKKN